MSSSSARALLLVLFKSRQSERSSAPSMFASLGHVQSYESIAQSNDQEWTDAFVTEIDDERKLHQLDTSVIVEVIKADYAGENILVAPMIYSIECVKDTSIDAHNDVFFAVAFRLKEKLDQFPEDWFKATPYMSSCAGFKRSTVYKVIGKNPTYPFINMAVWSSLDSWKRAIGTEESRQAHQHQNHVQRTPFIGKLSQPRASN